MRVLSKATAVAAIAVVVISLIGFLPLVPKYSQEWIRTFSELLFWANFIALGILIPYFWRSSRLLVSIITVIFVNLIFYWQTVSPFFAQSAPLEITSSKKPIKILFAPNKAGVDITSLQNQGIDLIFTKQELGDEICREIISEDFSKITGESDNLLMICARSNTLHPQPDLNINEIDRTKDSISGSWQLDSQKLDLLYLNINLPTSEREFLISEKTIRRGLVRYRESTKDLLIAVSGVMGPGSIQRARIKKTIESKSIFEGYRAPRTWPKIFPITSDMEVFLSKGLLSTKPTILKDKLDYKSYGFVAEILD